MKDICLTFPGGKRVEATIGNHHIVTDQTLAHGGDDSAPEPFELFLAIRAAQSVWQCGKILSCEGSTSDGL